MRNDVQVLKTDLQHVSSNVTWGMSHVTNSLLSLESKTLPPDFWEGTAEEVEEKKRLILTFLEETKSQLKFIIGQIDKTNWEVTAKYVADEELRKEYKSGYETGLKWGTGVNDNYRPGGPFLYTKVVPRWPVEEQQKAIANNLKEQHRAEQWFLGFDDGLAKRDELGLYVPSKARKPNR